MDRMEQLLNQWLWKEHYWLPSGRSWQDVGDDAIEGARRPLPRDLLLSLPLALGFIAVRFVFERAVALPLSRALGVFDRMRVRVPPHPKLEAFYLQKKKHFSQTPWFWDHRECWRGHPRQPMTEAQYWYYLLELSFYWSLLFCVSVDVKRKDFKEQIVHHIATIFLIGFSYCGNYIRVGTIVMLVHDSSDFLLESAKMFNYAGWRKTCDSLFVLFAVVFLVTRLIIFPCRVVYSTLVESLDFFDPFPGYYLCNTVLLVLQALHIFWAYLILRMVYKFVFLGKVERDERSDEESEVEEEEEEEGAGVEEESYWESRRGPLKSNPVSLANNCVLNNLTNQRRNINSRLPKAR
ncbi:ceramide synthase 4a isoform X2 [Salminus brasiliensis]|uniref:ceramide synthase 4a isoform X2 n=1 Tax=Salminus brasiliensis TaxID=930266 RepID=UPI003B83368B